MPSKNILTLGTAAAFAARAVLAQSVTMMPINGTTTAATVVPMSSVWTYWNTTVSTVVVVEELTTVCPEETTYTFNDCEYPVTKGETLVVTNCPCTLTTAVPTMTSSLCPPGVVAPAPAPPTETPLYESPAPAPTAGETHVPPPPPGAGSPSGAVPSGTSVPGGVQVSGAAAVGRVASFGAGALVAAVLAAVAL
ncbi:hypothetical protein MGN70_013706 [Eutypa lata]|nr:hypothetical protein MGN70_013706 [Eutypa lata]